MFTILKKKRHWSKSKSLHRTPIYVFQLITGFHHSYVQLQVISDWWDQAWHDCDSWFWSRGYEANFKYRVGANDIYKPTLVIHDTSVATLPIKTKINPQNLCDSKY